MPPETTLPTFTVEFETTTDDIVRAYLFTASGNRRNAKFWSVPRIVLVVVLLLLEALMAWNIARDPKDSAFAFVGVLAFGYLLYFVTAATAINVNRLIRNSPGLAGRRKIVVSPDQYSIETEYQTATLRWPLLQRVDYHEGDTLIYTNTRIATLIPRRAFDSDKDAEAFFAAAYGYWQEARAASPVIHDDGAGSADVWPPRPTTTFEPLPAIGPTYDNPVRLAFKITADDYATLAPMVWRRLMLVPLIAMAVVFLLRPPQDIESLVITIIVVTVILISSGISNWRKAREALIKDIEAIRQSALDQTIETDFVNVTVTTPESATAYAVAGLLKVRTTRKHVLVYVSPFATLMLPFDALGGDGPARGFATRMSDAIKASKEKKA